MIGRIEEKNYLQSLLKEDEPQFVAVYGKRRIGKTYLIRESFEHNFTFEHTGVSNSSINADSCKSVQLQKFEESLVEFGYKPAKKISSWNETFNGLKEIIKASNENVSCLFCLCCCGNSLLTSLVNDNSKTQAMSGSSTDRTEPRSQKSGGKA